MIKFNVSEYENHNPFHPVLRIFRSFWLKTMASSPFSLKDRTTLRDLARRVAEIAAEPCMEQRRQMWIEHNSLRTKEPMMLVFPEGSWVELIPEDHLACEGAAAQVIELNLRQRIYTYEHFQDDTVIEAEWVEPAWFGTEYLCDSGWGVQVQREERTSARGSWKFAPIIKDSHDLTKLHHPEIRYDQAAHDRVVESHQDLFGDILEVKKNGVKHISFHLLQLYTDWCGLENVMYDMLDRPDFVHEVLSFIEAGCQNWIRQLKELNLLSLNNDNTYHSSGGNGYADELPAPGYEPTHVRPIDMWASAESQEFQVVSPEMHAEFALQYEKPLLAHFGLNGYGCCEDLGAKLPDVFTIPNIRRISISPFANVEQCASQLKGDYIFSWKPHPAHLVGDFQPERIRETLQHTLDAAKTHGNVLEIILKDTHTCDHRPKRFDQWTQICRDLIEAY